VFKYQIRQLDSSDREFVLGFVTEHWGAPIIVAHGDVYRVDELPGFAAFDQAGVPVGLVTYRILDQSCEIVSLDSLRPRQGLGAALVRAVEQAASQGGCRRLWLITTNDNLLALQFYQKLGFHLVRVHPDAVTRARAIKPEIPLMGDNGIPIRDELELEMELI
jgi:GNAT superfamily N-acetyltransferase